MTMLEPCDYLLHNVPQTSVCQRLHANPKVLQLHCVDFGHDATEAKSFLVFFARVGLSLGQIHLKRDLENTFAELRVIGRSSQKLSGGDAVL